MALLKRSGMRVHAVFDGVLRKGGELAAAKARKPKKQGLTFWKPPLKNIPEYNIVYIKAAIAAKKLQERA